MNIPVTLKKSLERFGTYASIGSAFQDAVKLMDLTARIYFGPALKHTCSRTSLIEDRAKFLSMFSRNHYRPKRSFGQGNIFTGVCLSTGGGGACSKFWGGCLVRYPPLAGTPPGQAPPPAGTTPPSGRHPPLAGTPPRAGTPPPPGIWSTLGRYASHWNAFLFTLFCMELLVQ